jgi:hypothetical protein
MNNSDITIIKLSRLYFKYSDKKPLDHCMKESEMEGCFI